MKIEQLETKTVGSLVAENYKTADVFKKHGIDFCCGGGVSVKEICEKKGLDYDQIAAELVSIGDQTSKSYDYDSWELDFLIDHIINVHHSYVKDSLPLLLQYSDKVSVVHGHYFNETVEIKNLVRAVVEELNSHMFKEEAILFPFVKQMVQSQRTGEPSPTPPFGTVQGPIAMMEQEHDSAGQAFKKIAELSNNHTPPEEACNTYRVLYSKLKEFEEDLHIHIHLENNILFPKAVALEAAISARA